MNAYRTLSAQRGAVLPVTMVMLLLLTLLAVTGMRGSRMENRLSGDRAEMRRVFNAAESALREVEQRLARLSGAEDGRAAACMPGDSLCVLLGERVREVREGRVHWCWSAAPTAWWADPQNAIDYRGSDGVTRFVPAPREHAAVVGEDGGGVNLSNLGDPAIRTHYYQVNAYARGGSGGAPVILQSVYARRHSN
jgi:type IV pilus assembly protein PilX